MHRPGQTDKHLRDALMAASEMLSAARVRLEELEAEVVEWKALAERRNERIVELLEEKEKERLAMPKFNPADDPIVESLRPVMNEIAKQIDRAVTGATGEKYGFALLVFDFGRGGTLSYISNTNREDVIKTMKEFIARNEPTNAPETQG